jgi:WD40 repeat protein
MYTDRRIFVLLLTIAAIAAETKPERTDCYGDPLPAGAIARMRTIRLRQYQITKVAFSPNGELLASSGWDGMVRVWDAATGKEIHVFATDQGYHGCFAFAPDGKLLVAGGSDRTIRFWSLATGKQVRAFQAPDVVHQIAYSPNGKALAMIGGKKARLCEAATGKEILAIPAPQEEFYSLAFSPNGKTLATGASHRTVGVDGAAYRLA